MQNFNLEKKTKQLICLKIWGVATLFWHFHTAEQTYTCSPQCQPECWSPITNHNPAIFSASSRTERLNKSPTEQTKNPGDSNMLHVFNNNTYIISEQPTNTS